MKKKLLAEIRIEPVDKGFIVHHSSNNMGPGKYQEPTKHLFPDHPSMMKHVLKVTKATTGRPKSFTEAMKSFKTTTK